MPSPYPVPFWASPLVHVGLLGITMVQTLVRVPTHRHLLAGVTLLNSELTRFSSRFPRLITIRTQGDDAVPGSRRVGDCTQQQLTSYQALA
jgi:hypothetical protein